MRTGVQVSIQGFLDFWTSGLLASGYRSPAVQKSSRPHIAFWTAPRHCCPDESRNRGSGSSAEAETQDARTRI